MIISPNNPNHYYHADHHLHQFYRLYNIDRSITYQTFTSLSFKAADRKYTPSGLSGSSVGLESMGSNRNTSVA